MSDKRSSGRTIRAAGGVVWMLRGGVIHVALVHRPRYDDWSLPKGKLEAGESELAAAVREIGEELGSRVAVSRLLPSISYRADGARKRVAYWTMRHLSGEFVATDEVDDVAWVPVPEALARCSYRGDRVVLDAFAAVPTPDSVIVLVRHAKAGKRSEWSGPDVERPLDAAGRRQSQALVGFLHRFAPERVVSAEPTRCVQTMEPFAGDTGLDVVVDPAFGDESYERDPGAAQQALLALAAPRTVSVVCSQGATIPGLVPAVMPGIRSAETRKAGAWVLSFVDGTAVGADYYGHAGR